MAFWLSFQKFQQQKSVEKLGRGKLGQKLHPAWEGVDFVEEVGTGSGGEGVDSGKESVQEGKGLDQDVGRRLVQVGVVQVGMAQVGGGGGLG